MGTFKHLQRKSSIGSTSGTPTSHSLRSSRPIAPARVPTPEQVSHHQQTQPTYSTRLKYSLADIPLFPPERENRAGLPNHLKAGIENLSGMAMDDVHVHYNSSKPAEIQALAYTRGSEIHVGPGQEKHLPHEAWHVVQQKQGRVSPTIQLHGRGVNDDSPLEREADMMGKRVSQAGVWNGQRKRVSDASSNTRKVIQRKPVPVGFDRIGLGGREDTLITSGLGNCIAVVAYDPDSKTAVMAHYDTGQGNSGSEPALKKLKSMLIKRLQDSIGGKENIKPVFHVGIGSAYVKFRSKEAKREKMRLIVALNKVFGVNPTQCGYTIEFNIGTGVMVRDMEMLKPNLKPPENWEHEGDEIDYNELIKE